MSTIEAVCPGCKTRYSVPAAMAGKVARCQKAGCGQAISIPWAGESPAQAPVQAQAVAEQYYLAVGSQQIGPVPKSELDRYANSGTASPQAQVRRSGQQQWRPIGALYSHLAPPTFANPFVAHLADLQAQHRQYQEQLAHEAARGPKPSATNPYVSPLSYSRERTRAYSGGGMPGILIAMCIVVFVMGVLRITHAIFSFSKLGEVEAMIESAKKDPGVQLRQGVEARIWGQKVGIIFGAILACGEVGGAVLLLLRKRAGKLILKGFSWVTIGLMTLAAILMLVGLVLGGAAIATSGVPGLAGAALAVIVFIVLIAFGLIAAYYWFIFYTLSRDHVEDILE